MERRATLAVLVGLVAVVLFAAVTTAGEVRLADGPPTFFDDVEPGRLPPPSPPGEVVEGDPGEEPRDEEVSPWVEQIARLLGWSVLVVGLVLTVAVLVRTRPRLGPWRRRHSDDDTFEVLADMAATVGAGADAQRAALGRGSPRNAIVECWLLLEAAVTAAGVPRRAADTAAELTERVLGDHDVDAAALGRLAALYREARFSNHTMDEASRRAAIQALDTVHRTLDAGAPPTVGTHRPGSSAASST